MAKTIGGNYMSEGKVKKSIFKRWWFWAIVVIIVIGAIGSNGSKDNDTTTSSEQKSTTSKSEPTKAPELAKEGTSSDVKIAVTAVESMQEIGNNQFTKKKAQGVFKVLTLQLTNNQKDAITIDSNSFKLVDDKGREFSYSSDGQTAIMTSGSNDESFFLKKLNPGLSITGKVVFDVPQDATGFYLKARGGMTGKEIKLKVD